jgi:nucleotide-binding universal stress UspA family protein
MSLFPTNILQATEGSENSLPALRVAAGLSAETGSGVHTIFVGNDTSTPAAYNGPGSKDKDAAGRARELIDGQIHEIEKRDGKVAESHAVPGGNLAQEIIKFTREPDIGMVVVGSRGLGRFRYAFQGSVSAAVVRDAYCPVIVVHGDENEKGE